MGLGLLVSLRAPRSIKDLPTQDLSKDALAPTLESSVGDGKECLDPSYDLLS